MGASLLALAKSIYYEGKSRAQSIFIWEACLALRPGGAGSEVWNGVYMIAPVKKFGRVRLSTIFPSKQIWRRRQTWRDDEFLLGFEFSRVQTSGKRFQEHF